MGKCGCGEEFQDGWEWLCRTCNPTSTWSGRVQATFKDGSGRGDSFISQKYYESVQKRKFKKSEETIAEERGEI